MTAEELWRCSGLTGEYEAWAFGEAPDKLASLVKGGIKTATCSAYDLCEAFLLTVSWLATGLFIYG